jgi:hypothetical protein
MLFVSNNEIIRHVDFFVRFLSLNSPLNYCNYLSMNCLQIAMYFH